MPLIERGGVPLHYTDEGEGPAMVLVHGWAGSTEMMARQAEHFRRTHRVISVDLRGHGRSGKPAQEYTIGGFSEDIAHVLREVGVERAALVGQSLGGTIVLDLAARFPELASAVVILEALLFPPPHMAVGFVPVAEGLQGPQWASIARGFLATLFGPYFPAQEKAWWVEEMMKTPHQVMVSAFGAATTFDAADAASRVKAPLIYVSSGPWYTDVERFRSHAPQLVTAQAVGCGHYFQLEVPDQVNAMVGRFLEVYARR